MALILGRFPHSSCGASRQHHAGEANFRIHDSIFDSQYGLRFAQFGLRSLECRSFPGEAK